MSKTRPCQNFLSKNQHIESNTSTPLSPTDQKLWDDYTSGQMSLTVGVRSATPIRKPTHVKKSLDLHGMTIEQAYRQTKEFIGSHHLLGTKQVVIICGKGGRIAHELPLWCRRFDQISKISPITDSRGEHGSYRVVLKIKKIRNFSG